MSRYPSGIQGHGSSCSICGEPKYINGRVCRRCNPVFSSWSVAMNWAREHASGPCVVMYRTIGPFQQVCGYAEWPGAQKGAAA